MKYLIVLSAILLASCSPKIPAERIVTQIEYVTPDIAIQTRPRPVTLNGINFEVVTAENLDAFITKISASEQGVAFIAMSTDEYKKLTLNVAELRRYINQQTQIIVFYEKSITAY